MLIFFRLILLLALIAYALGGWWFWHYSHHAVAPSVLPTTPAVAVFTGGQGRVPETFEIVARGYAGPVLITSLYRDTKPHELVGYSALTPAQQAQLTFDYTAQNTRDNVRVTAHWLTQHSAHAVTIVTAAYHVPRSRLLWAQQGGGVPVAFWPIVTPTPPHGWDLVREYHKLIATVFYLL